MSETQLLKYKLRNPGKTTNADNPWEATAQKAVRARAWGNTANRQAISNGLFLFWTAFI